MKLAPIVLVSTSLLMGSAVAEAAIVFSDRASFLAAAGPVTTEGFESFPGYADCSVGGPTPATSLATAQFTVTTSPRDGGTVFFCIGTAGTTEPHPTEGNNALVAGSLTGDRWFLDFYLNAPTVAIGLDITDLAESGDVAFRTSAGESALVQSCCIESGTELFFGYIADQPFNSFRMENNGRGDGWGIDQVSISIWSVPEPGTLALLGLGLAGLGLSRRRKANRASADFSNGGM